VALYLAQKVEEVQTQKVENMTLAANNIFETCEIIQMEQDLYRALNFRVIPPTLNNYANLFMVQWDAFTEKSQYARDHTLLRKADPVKFLVPCERSYKLFRSLLQLLDAASLEVQTLQYKQKALIASFIYLVIGKELGQFDEQSILEEFPRTSLYLFNRKNAFNDLYAFFLSEFFGIDIFGLLPTIQFAATFFGVKLAMNLPVAAKIDRKNVLEKDYEEFLAYQTHNADALKFVLESRDRLVN
jgi:hypothetical protein